MPKEIEVKSILNKSKHRDSWFLSEYSINLYSSCSFNCLYCYIRGSKYGSNLASSLSVKVNAIDLLRKQLAVKAKKEQHGFIVACSATDPYPKIETEYKLTRQALGVIAQHRFPVHMLTKSPLIERDIDLLKQIEKGAVLPDDLKSVLPGGLIISFSFSTLDDDVAKIFEPGAPRPSERLASIGRLLEQGFFVGISLMPLLPWIADTTEKLEETFSTFKKLGVHFLLPATLTLFGNEKASSKTLYFRALEKHYPELLPKYLKYFENSNEMPSYYWNAFQKKMRELSVAHQIQLSILDGAKVYNNEKNNTFEG